MLVYMQVSGITGVGGPPRPDWIPLEDCQFGFFRKESGTENTSDPSKTLVKAGAKQVTITKFSDRATPSLAAWLNSAEPRQVDIEYCVNPTLWLVGFTLIGARLRSYKADFSASIITESLSIDYESIMLDYFQQDQTNRDAASSDFEFPAPA
jgi:type VI protein secretion system component Hcp